jgi:hypothetical protein
MAARTGQTAPRGVVQLLELALCSLTALALASVLLLESGFAPAVHHQHLKQLQQLRQGGTPAAAGAAARGGVRPAAETEPSEPQLPPVHVLYNVGCEGSSNWALQLVESLTLDLSWQRVGQRGKLTRLVSGCIGAEHAGRRAEMSKSVLAEGDGRFDTRFSPLAERLSGGAGVYVMANRPAALSDFFSQELAAGADPRTVYVVLDPDFIMLRPRK